jgi:CheY-like chemotaxis protein
MEAVGQLTGGVAHDFNNLLSATMTNAQLLEISLEGSEELQIMAGEIIKASRRGAELTHRLLAFSRKQTLQPKSLDLHGLCEGMMDMLQRSLGEDIEIELVPAQSLWSVLADPGQVENALLNLAINARDAMLEGGKLTITMENNHLDKAQKELIPTNDTDAFVSLTVTDTGIGIPQEILSQVFDPFFTTKEVGKGSGLGLSMVYGFAQQSGGFTEIKSKRNEGTSVSIYLRKAEPEPIAASSVSIDSNLHLGNGEIILLVEDNENVQQAIAAMLKVLGYTVHSAQNGVMALNIAQQSDDIDLLLTDIVLPGDMNGIELSEKIRADQPKLKCLFMSGYAALPNHQIPINGELVGKPFEIESIAIKLREILD